MHETDSTASPRVRKLLDELTLDEEVALLAGATLFESTPVQRLGIPAVGIIDGPSGARGREFLAHSSLNVPTGSALGATWDPDLVERLGDVLGRQVRAKGARIHLAPTVNLHRTPVGGRNFESHSEDPWLASRLALAYVTGVQRHGVASCVKHFVGNDTEFERVTIDSRIDEVTLREVYLRPFEAAVCEGGAAAIMAAYNGVNGTTVSEHTALLEGLLRTEWGFDGVVISDWWGTRSTVEALVAGIDLEMPGPTAQRGAKLIEAVTDGRVSRDVVRRAVGRLLTLYERLGALDDGPTTETTLDDPADRATVRRAAASAMVLLQNRVVDGVPTLPIDGNGLGRIALIGPNAARGQFNGGGSAFVRPTRSSHPLDAFEQRLPGWEVVSAPGCLIDIRSPLMDVRHCTDLRVELFADPDGAADPERTPDETLPMDTTRLLWFDDPFRARQPPAFSARVRTTFTADRAGEWTIGFTSVGDGRLIIDGELVLDNGDVALAAIAAMGKPELTTTIELAVGEQIELEFQLRRISDADGLTALLIGCRPPAAADPIAEAVTLAQSADVTVLVVGTSGEYETEGRDRDDIALPGDQNALIEAVSAVSSRTVVVLNIGAPVAMPWLDRVDAVLVSWFAGQELGDALVDVLTGVVEPQGRLPMTFPRQLADSPAFEHHPGRDGIAEYAEGRLIGHRWYDLHDIEPLFGFGFGLGYATTDIVGATLVDPWSVEVVIQNRSDRDGVAVAQVYASLPDRDGMAADEPPQRLVGFAKVDVAACGSRAVVVELDPRAYQGWDTEVQGWSDHGRAVELRIGHSSRDVAVTLAVPAADRIQNRQ